MYGTLIFMMVMIVYDLISSYHNNHDHLRSKNKKRNRFMVP